MNMKKMKKFFTLSRRAEGFTLVELIVVIAILAILGGVAVPAYGGYVKKANMTADQALVAEVADALTLYYYSHAGEEIVGYVVLSPNDNARVDDAGIGAAAMQAVFGDNWQQTANLKYSEWAGVGLMNEVSSYTDDQLAAIGSSSFFGEKTSTKDMMTVVNNLLGYAANEIKDSQNIATHLDTLGIDVGNSLDGIAPEDMGTVISNLLVGHYSGAIDQGKLDDNDPMVNLMYIYANAYAYSAETGNTEYLTAVETAIQNAAADPNGGMDALNELGSGNTDWSEYVGEEAYEDYCAKFEDTPIASNNIDALKAMMGAVSNVSSNFSDKEDLINPNLYTSEEVLDQMNGYANAVKAAINGMSLPPLNPGEVAVVLFADGSIYTTISVAS